MFSSRPVMKTKPLRYPNLFAFDAIGFDVDHTLCKYKLYNLYKLIYDGLSKYLVDERRYNKQIFYPITKSDWDFCFKGLVLDIKKGNFLKLLDNGYICRASHGSRMLSDGDIVRTYGERRQWPMLSYYLDVLNFNNRHLQREGGYRVCEDYFQVPAILASAKIIDFVDNMVGKPLTSYTFWDDVLDAMVYIYLELGFGDTPTNGDVRRFGSRVYPDLFKNPDRYLVKSDPSVISLLKQLNTSHTSSSGCGHRTLFLLTSAGERYVDHALSHVIGDNWRQYFHLYVYNARKPGFFTKADHTKTRPFYTLEGHQTKTLVRGSAYKLGNYNQIHSFLQRSHNSNDVKVCYIGDSIQSDIYPVHECTQWSAISICEELMGAVKENDDSYNNNNNNSNNIKTSLPVPPLQQQDEVDIIHSVAWGPYLTDGGRPTLWSDIISNSSLVSVPSFSHLAAHTLQGNVQLSADKKE